MNKEYNLVNDQQNETNESAIEYGSNLRIADALWTIIANQSSEVQTIISERLSQLRNESSFYQPYTLQEITQRIDEAEEQLLSGDVLHGDDVHKRIRDFINKQVL